MVFLLCWHWRRSPPCAGWRRWYRGKLPGRWCSGLGPQSRESGRAHRETWKTKGEEEVVAEEKGVWCVMTELNKTSNRKNYFGSLAGWVDVAVHRQLIVMSGAARLGLKGPRGQVEVEQWAGHGDWSKEAPVWCGTTYVNSAVSEGSRAVTSCVIRPCWWG